jgi:hypothetical protein
MKIFLFNSNISDDYKSGANAKPLNPSVTLFNNNNNHHIGLNASAITTTATTTYGAHRYGRSGTDQIRAQTTTQ